MIEVTRCADIPTVLVHDYFANSSTNQNTSAVPMTARKMKQKMSIRSTVSLLMVIPRKFRVSILKCELAGELVFMRVSFLRIVLYAGLEGIVP